jgi:hypothetical protein
MSNTDSAGRDDTHNTRDNPRAAGAASDRGAQPSGQRAITICQRCRKRLMQVRNGEWYHERNSSVFCDHTDGTRRKAIPISIEARR